MKIVEKQNNLQEIFLNRLRKEREQVVLFLINGVKLQGTITWFDNFCLLLQREGHSQLVYKHGISTIMPVDLIQFYELETQGL